ncbi:hypothetical protein [Bacillus cereus]|nr:hypothetical protein [Bacillus cereus]
MNEEGLAGIFAHELGHLKYVVNILLWRIR